MAGQTVHRQAGKPAGSRQAQRMFSACSVAAAYSAAYSAACSMQGMFSACSVYPTGWQVSWQQREGVEEAQGQIARPLHRPSGLGSAGCIRRQRHTHLACTARSAGVQPGRQTGGLLRRSRDSLFQRGVLAAPAAAGLRRPRLHSCVTDHGHRPGSAGESGTQPREGGAARDAQAEGSPGGCAAQAVQRGTYPHPPPPKKTVGVGGGGTLLVPGTWLTMQRCCVAQPPCTWTWCPDRDSVQQE